MIFNYVNNNIVFLLGYYYYMRNTTDKVVDKRTLLETKKTNESIDDVKVVKEVESKTPLDIALDHKTEGMFCHYIFTKIINMLNCTKYFVISGNDYFKKGVFDKAIACYTKAIELCPSDSVTELATFYQNRAAAYDSLKKYSKVIEDCSKALNLKATYTKALYRRARAFESLKEWSDCLDDISAVCLLQSFQVSIIMNLFFSH